MHQKGQKVAINSAVVAFETVDQLPGGRAVLILEAPGDNTWKIVKGHMEEQALTEMSDHVRWLIAKGRWVQNWERPPATEAGSGTPFTVDIRIADELPAGKTVDSRESPGHFVWLILKGNITEQARREMEAEMRFITNNGHWKQVFPGPDEPSS
ncbi:hypothetical protein [Streptomyces sp. NBC_00474]|uniref:hypothetical protein n=1 Tax=Streptomyces sp. NBC_00474 TaxID=2975754 RepID=UPI00225A59FA|nr:hypothetical protein [Streptomyces sp. NBC_00474]MCX5050978.1 hypothetical protein [Streptomyces sp. NBC_00474]